MLWHAERFVERLPNGRTRPIITDCAAYSDDGELVERRTMVLKTIGLPEITSRGLFAEYFGSLLAIQFGIDAASPELVTVGEDLVGVSTEALARWGVAPVPGVAVGLEYRAPMLPLNSLKPVVGRPDLNDAALIYAFDLLTQNPDRRSDNPNCAMRNRRLVAYDFEMAFSFLLPIIGAPDPWRVSALTFRRQHVFWNALREDMAWPDWELAITATNSLNERAEQLATFLPEEWTEHGHSVRAHIQAVCEHINEFHDELQGSLT
jgi:hypothetical protein